ncbi:transmembrane 220 family protein [Marimonas arenosa]|uniref:Transmembrane 220 family protein n=1 Tax=Marimonas arenosa TaxID=1795305 RepID=A0AAE3WFP2_9RHOB|nr:transmembrane 220 family protein [Marimonas arenosa]MDQ2090835.1 transmembrane 220 family protein [Marimonas arenosa]
MRVISAVFCILMVLFAAVQYNDPDALFWGVIYGVAAIWCGLAAFRPASVSGAAKTLLVVCLAIAVFGVVWFWPQTPGFWRQEVWWNTETAREGMGMAITLAALGVAWLAVRRGSAQA